MKTQIFLDSGDPNETREAIKLLGFLDGQTTNPSLVAKNPEAQGKKFTEEEILEFYKKIVQEISMLIPNGSVSIEVPSASASQMLEMTREMFTWIPNAHIKLPINSAGLETAEQAVKIGIRVNMTLCFSQGQAAAVYAATLGAKDVFVSPFVGRLDDRGENGMDLIKNILKMYEKSDHHVKVVVASVRNLGHFLAALALEADIITAPLKVLKEWSELRSSPYKEIDLSQNWHKFNISHELTEAGIEKFSKDWSELIV